MSAIVYLLFIISAIYFGITWVLPKLIGWILIQKFNIKIRFGRISLPFSLRDVNICKNGFSVQIDEVCIRSSFFNSEVTKLLSFIIRDIRINKDINKKIIPTNEQNAGGSEFNVGNCNQKHKKEKLDFRNRKVPPSIIKFAQFMAVHVNNISVVLMNNEYDPGWLLHATARELRLDGSIVYNLKNLLVSAALCDAQAKILRHCPKKPNVDVHNKTKPCLAEFSFGISMDGGFIAEGPLLLEKLQLSMNNSKVILHDGLYDFIKAAQKAKQFKNTSINECDLTTVDESNLTSDTYQRLSPIIPKTFSIKIEDTSISAVRENNSNDFNAKLELFTVNGKFNSIDTKDIYILPVLYTGVHLHQLEVDTMHEKLLFIEQFSIDSKLEKDVINIYSKLKSFQLIYNHTEIYNWMHKNVFNNHDSDSMKLAKSLNLSYLRSKEKLLNSNNKPSILEEILKHVVIKGCAELWNVATILKIDNQQSLFNISHTKLLLEQYNQLRNNIYDNKIFNLLLDKRHWSAELMVESLWWSLGIQNTINKDSSSLKKAHVRNSPFYLGVSLIKLSSYGDTTKLDISVHTLRTEYSSNLFEFLLKSVDCLQQYQSIKSTTVYTETTKEPSKIVIVKKNEDNKTKPKSNWDNILLINCKISDISCYLYNEHNNCILGNLNEITLSRTKQSTKTCFDSVTMAILNCNSMKSNATTISITDFTNVFVNIKSIRLDYYPNGKKSSSLSSNLTMYVIDDSEFLWNSNLHMHITSLQTEMKNYKEIMMNKEFMEKLIANKKSNSKPINDDDNKSNNKIIFDIYAEGNTEFGIKISERHSLQIFLDNLNVNSKERFRVSVENIFINIDGSHIFTLKDFDIQSLKELQILRNERQNYDHFILRSNSVWATTIGGFKGVFPYDHDFYDAFQNEFVSLYRWLKIVHNIQKKPFTADSPLPCDMIIQIKEFLLEISDDPFEVKLRDNYVLLMDEYNESVKRKKIFDQKITELCSGLMVPAGKLQELTAQLVQKDSEIYIKRSKKLNEGSTRTRLLAWVMTDLEIMAMADPSVHGTENVCRMMRHIDNESPWPEDDIEFVTLWCRAVNVSCTEWKFLLRDYPQPMFHVEAMHLCGNLCGAEQLAPRRAKRDVQIEIGEPFSTVTIQRGMNSLKFYHDFDWELETLRYAFGPCWEPVMAQCNLSLEKISAPSRDPSPSLPFWDKLRLLLHGRLTILAKRFTILLHASLDPYNTTEEMELTWHQCGIIWTNAKFMFKGDLTVSVRTASRYDDCRLLHLPNLKLTFKLNWICLANPNDHHSVIPCAPDKLPEYSSNQVHDSFRAFRSQNLNIWVSFEIKQSLKAENIDIPSLVLYGSTLRWFESLNLILSGVTRPTRRGPVFNNVRPRKKQLSRHYKKAHLQMSLQKFQIFYWMSHAMQRGFQLNGGRVSFSSEHTLTLRPVDDGLIHRPLADWSIMYINCELNDTEIWLRTTTVNEKYGASTETLSSNSHTDNCRDYFLSVAKVSYGREAMLNTGGNERQKDTPTHKLVVYDMKGAWTKNNRDVAFALFDSFMKTQKLKDNLSTEALKCSRKEGNNTPLKRKSSEASIQSSSGQILSGSSSTTTPLNKHQQSHQGTAMLQQLIAEADHKSVVFSDDLSTQTREQQLKGLQACQDDDVSHYNWFISLVNSQVLLKGCETSGYIILSAAKAEILQRVHRPVWRDRTIVSKTTWVGSLECMQYYATVSAEESDPCEVSEIMWLTVDNIQEKDKDSTVINEFPDLPHLVGSGQSVGGVVSETVGGATGLHVSGEKLPLQLQRIVSRCKCEFFYVSYGETSIDPSTITEVPPPPSDDTISPWERQDEPVDAFTLMHHDLDVCTNSLQYAMILDVVNNLLLYVEPQRKEAMEKLARMRFQLQLYSSEDQKRPIQHLQTQIRSLMSKIRSLEKDIHFIGKERLEEGDSEELRHELETVQKHINEYKEMLTTQSDELDMMLSCYKETQINASNKLAKIRKDKPLTIMRANEICFKHAQWRLTEADGQIGIADLILSNFLYTKNSRSDDSVEHLLELGYIRINNLIPRDSYKEVLCPTEIQRDMPVDQKRVLRVFCREKPPVGGISVKEHFEINVVPITIAISKKFFITMLKFCFPDRDAEAESNDDIDDTGSTSSLRTNSSKRASTKQKKNAKDSNFYVKIEKDDVEKMKERAEKNKLFIYIKIPEVPVRVSYKGNKEKNLEDITDLSLLIPTLEYHNVTWTWLDLLLAMKSDSRRVLLSQAIKQKLKFRTPLSLTDERPSPQEEDKAKMLFGNRHAPENKSLRKGVFNKFSKS